MISPEQIVECAVEGCGRHLFARGWCSRHYRAWYYYGDALHVSTYHPSRKREIFWSRVSRLDPDSCWEWQAGRTPEGYGAFRFNGKNRLVHRLAYEWLVGPISDGLHLDHLCRNTLCVNPRHLEPVTARTNILRGFGPSAVNARKTHCHRGHPLDGENVYHWKDQRHCRICRRRAERKWRERHRA